MNIAAAAAAAGSSSRETSLRQLQAAHQSRDHNSDKAVPVADELTSGAADIGAGNKAGVDGGNSSSKQEEHLNKLMNQMSSAFGKKEEINQSSDHEMKERRPQDSVSQAVHDDVRQDDWSSSSSHVADCDVIHVAIVCAGRETHIYKLMRHHKEGHQMAHVAVNPSRPAS